jgi:hypothetical protein
MEGDGNDDRVQPGDAAYLKNARVGDRCNAGRRLAFESRGYVCVRRQQKEMCTTSHAMLRERRCSHICFVDIFAARIAPYLPL